MRHVKGSHPHFYNNVVASPCEPVSRHDQIEPPIEGMEGLE